MTVKYKIYFYPHLYLRDRQLDTIRHWPSNEVLNPEIAQDRQGAQVSKEKATAKKRSLSWKQILPLLNIKLRPKQAPKDAIIYVWGGLITTGSFIVDIDNPWSLVGYNIPAMSLYKFFIKKILLSDRCLEIRCMSEACRKSLLYLFGEMIYKKSRIHYPIAGIQAVSTPLLSDNNSVKFIFIGSQFEIKGGGSLLAAFKEAQKIVPNISLTIITHFPVLYEETIKETDNVEVFPPEFLRKDIYDLMRKSDVLVHPSYMESFGMTILEGMANGLVIIANDIYAISEMVSDGENGYLLVPPISKWSGVLPNQNFRKQYQFVDKIQELDIKDYVRKLSDSMIAIASDPKKMNLMKKKSIKKFSEMKDING